MKALLKLALPALLQPCFAWSSPQIRPPQQVPDKIKSSRIIFTENQVPNFIAVERRGKTYIVLYSNPKRSSLDIKKQ